MIKPANLCPAGGVANVDGGVGGPKDVTRFPGHQVRPARHRQTPGRCRYGETATQILAISADQPK
jgi:hypothetical protein